MAQPPYDFTDADQTLSLTESTTTGDEEILNHYRIPHSNDVTMMKGALRSLDLLKDQSRSKMFAALELIQNCSLFEEEQVVFHL